MEAMLLQGHQHNLGLLTQAAEVAVDLTAILAALQEQAAPALSY